MARVGFTGGATNRFSVSGVRFRVDQMATDASKLPVAFVHVDPSLTDGAPPLSPLAETSAASSVDSLLSSTSPQWGKSFASSSTEAAPTASKVVASEEGKAPEAGTLAGKAMVPESTVFLSAMPPPVAAPPQVKLATLPSRRAVLLPGRQLTDFPRVQQGRDWADACADLLFSTCSEGDPVEGQLIFQSEQLPPFAATGGPVPRWPSPVCHRSTQSPPTPHQVGEPPAPRPVELQAPGEARCGVPPATLPATWWVEAPSETRRPVGRPVVAFAYDGVLLAAPAEWQQPWADEQLWRRPPMLNSQWAAVVSAEQQLCFGHPGDEPSVCFGLFTLPPRRLKHEFVLQKRSTWWGLCEEDAVIPVCKKCRMRLSNCRRCGKPSVAVHP